MPRNFGGHTSLGKELNEISNHSYGNKIRRRTVKRGIIKDVLGSRTNNGEYIVILEVYDSEGNPEGTTRPLPLNEDPLFLAANYGPPEELINRFWCKIEYEGPSYNRGNVTIISNPLRDKEAAVKSNELQLRGAAFAPPGSGMM